jgi:hypothetical protein
MRKRAGTPQARDVPANLVEAEIGPRRTEDAKARLQRLGRRSRKP